MNAPRTALISSAILFTIGCTATPGPDKSAVGAVLGAGWGAGAGAVVGNQLDNTGAGAALGSAFGAGAGLLTGMGLDMAEGTELEEQRQIDSLKVQVAANQRNLMALQDNLDARDRQMLRSTAESPQVFFDKDRASIRMGTAKQLERIAEELKRNPYIGRIELHGHSDNTGDVELNKRLSEARARTVATFLANQGISTDQLLVVAHGADQPLASNSTEAGRQLNRRVEIVLVR